jgi:Rhs family protein
MKVMQRLVLLLVVLVIMCSITRDVSAQGSCITNLSARAKSGKIQITWTHVAGTEHYEILRRVNPSDPFIVIDTTTSTYSAYLDIDITNGTTYYYYVRRVWDGGSSQCDSNFVYSTPLERRRRGEEPPTVDPNTIDNDFDGFTENTGDCDDTNNSVFPGAPELCDGLDNDCNGQVDDELTIDADGDGHTTPESCTGTKDDCDDADPNRFPGNPEVCDGIDNDCDGQIDEGLTSDSDGDGHTTPESCTGTKDDCDDAAASVHPGATEIPDNNIDEDCDGLDTTTVPNVVGIDQITAEANITATGLVVGAVTTSSSDTVPEGDVISQSPIGGTLLPEGSSIDLVVSLGPSAPILSSLEIFPGVLILTAQSETHQLSVTGTYSDDSTKDLTPSTEGTVYATADANIVGITPDGLVSAANNGTTIITVNNGTFVSQVPITVDIYVEEPYDPASYISGKVTDYNTGLPIAGAVIEKLEEGGDHGHEEDHHDETESTEEHADPVNTDAGGKFIFPVSDGGHYILFIRKQGYITAKKEVVIDPARNVTIEEALTPYETYRTHINAVEGGIATNESGTIEMEFPPGALPYDIDISATRLEKDGYPVPSLKGQEFVDSVQFEPEHVDFNEDVTVRFSNKLGFSPGTEIPWAYGAHDNHGAVHPPEFPYFDPGVGIVSEDGQWIELKMAHFSCPSLVLPSCGSPNRGDPVPEDGKRNPDTSHDGETDKGGGREEPTICGGSKVLISSGVLQISHQMTPYKTLGFSDGLSLTYRSNTADTGRILDIPVFNNTETMEKPEQITFTVEVEGVRQKTFFTGNTGDFAIGYYFDGKNAQGEILNTGVYQASFTVSNDYRKYLYTTSTFGGQPLTSTGVPVPDLVSYSNNTSRNLIINNQIDSPYGAGWGLDGIDRLYPVPDDPESALLVKGNGMADYFTLSSNRSVREKLAENLNNPTGIVYDSQGDLLVADKNNNKVLRITPSGEITTELAVSSPNGLAIASNDDLYIATSGGMIYKIDASTKVSSLYFTLPQDSNNTQDIEIDSLGNLYVYDTGGNHYLYMIDVNKQISTLIEGSDKLLVSSMAVSPDDDLYLAFNNSGFIDCSSSWIARYTLDGILVNFSDRLNSPAGITFSPDGTMYMVERECGEQEYKVYTIDKFGTKNIFFSHTPVGQDPIFSNIIVAHLTHDITWGPEGIAVTGTLANEVYKIKKNELAPPLGEHSTLNRNDDGTYTRRLTNGSTITFNSDGYQTSWADRNDNTIEYEYDGGGKLNTITDPAGRVSTLNYNNGKLQSITDPVGRTTIFQYDLDGNLASIKDPDNSNTTYTYNNNHLLTSKTVPTGETYSYEYDEYDRIVKSTAPTGEVRTYESGRMKAIVNNLPVDVGTEANPANIMDIKKLVNTYTDDEGNKATNRISMRGFTLEDKDALGRTTLFERDRDANIIRAEYPNGEVETMAYDNNGNLLTYTASSTGGRTTYSYDSAFNNITSITDPNGNVSVMEYDGKGNLTKTTDPLGNQTIMTYDDRGLLTSTTDALGKTSTFDFDGDGNLTTFTDPLGKTTFFDYDDAGNRTSMSDANGKTTLFQYDIVNNLLEMRSADGSITSFAYSNGEHCTSCGATNGGDLMTSLTDANGNKTTFSYNEIGQLTTTTNPTGFETLYVYDKDRKLISKTDPENQITVYLYDAADQLIQKDLTSDSVKYTYNPSGRLTSVEDTDSLVLRQYDLQDRMVQENLFSNTTGPVVIASDLTIPSGNTAFDNSDIIVENFATLTVNGDHTFNSMTLQDGAKLTHSGATTMTEDYIDITITGSLTIDHFSSIDVSGKGYLGGYSGNNGSPVGRTIGNTIDGGSTGRASGCYGGRGSDPLGSISNTVYGSLFSPDDLGSGGGAMFGVGGNGGGLVRITASDITLDGEINANGKRSETGGSGGGIYINTGTLTGSGKITANGRDSGGNGGSGGRIAVYYNDISGFNIANIAADGGTTFGAGSNGAGTIYMKSSTQTFGDLIIEYGFYYLVPIHNRFVPTTNTSLISVGTGTSTDLMPNTLTDDTGNWRADDLVGIYLTPNTDQGPVFKITGNDETTIQTDPADGDMTTVAANGDTYRGKFIFDHLLIRGGGGLETDDDVKVIDPTSIDPDVFEITDGALKAVSFEIGSYSLSISNGKLFADTTIPPGMDIALDDSTMETSTGLTTQTITVDNNSELSAGGALQTGDILVTNTSVLTHPDATITDEYRLIIDADSINIDSTSSIDVTGKGYLGGNSGDNSGDTGRTVGNTTNGGSTGFSGGSYAGLGGDNGGIINAVYGSLYNPNEPGSGGGGASELNGGDGGGLVRLMAANITLDGTIKADGATPQVGGGSGGGIYIKTGTLTGSGIITSNGSHIHGGGGGRIAVYYDDISGFSITNISAYGGTGGSSDVNGGAGTIYLKSSAQIYGDLIVDNHNTTTTGFSTPLPSVGSRTSTDLSENTLTDDTRAWLPDELSGIYLNPDINQATTPNVVFQILFNNSTSISVDNVANNLTDIASAGDTYIGEHYVDNLSVINGARVETLDRINFNSILVSSGGEIQAENYFQTSKKNNPFERIAGMDMKLFSHETMKSEMNDDREEKRDNGQKIENRMSNNEQRMANVEEQIIDDGKETKEERREIEGDLKLEPRNMKHDLVGPVNPVNKRWTFSQKPDNHKPALVASLGSSTTNNAFTKTVAEKMEEWKYCKLDRKTLSGWSPIVSLPEKHGQTGHKCKGLDPQYIYDLNGNRTFMIGPGGMFWAYEYDAADRLTKITNPINIETTFTYDANDRRTSMTYANGVTTIYTYDDAGRLTNMTTQNSIPVTIDSYSYTYNSVNGRISMADNYGNHTYQYDDLYRLTDATHPQAYNPDETFTYDAVGSRQSSILSANYLYDNLNRLLEDDQYTYNYDNNGNLISKIDKSNRDTTTYQYDEEDRLMQVETPSYVIQYQYDGFGRRTEKTVNGIVTKYIYDGRDVLFELDENDNIKVRYTHGPGIDEPISVERDTDSDGQLDTLYYYHYDGLGSVTAMTDSTGNIVQTYVYDSFGKIVQQTGSLVNSYTYTGREWDVESDLYYYRARYYDANIGRFIQSDPVGFVGGDVNFYAYVGNDPVNWLDSTGGKRRKKRMSPKRVVEVICELLCDVGSKSNPQECDDGQSRQVCKDRCIAEFEKAFSPPPTIEPMGFKPHPTVFPSPYNPFDAPQHR